MLPKLKHSISAFFCALLIASSAGAQNDQIVKYAIPGNPITTSFGSELCQPDVAPTIYGESFTSIGNVLTTAGVFEPFVSFHDAGFNVLSQTRVHYAVGGSFHQSGTTICQEPSSGDYYMGLTLLVSGTEYAYLVKLNPDGTVAWGHYWGQGRIVKVLFDAVNNQIVMMGLRPSGRILLAAVDPVPSGPLGNPYFWHIEDQLFASSAAVPVTPVDMVITPTGDIVTFGTSRHPSGDLNMTVMNHNGSGVISWVGDYGNGSTQETAKTLCIGPDSGVLGYSIMIGGEISGLMVTANLNAATGAINFSNRHALAGGARPALTDMEYNPNSDLYLLAGQITNPSTSKDAMVYPVNSAGNNPGFYWAYSTQYSGFNGDYVFRDIEFEGATGGMVCHGSGMHNNPFGVQGGEFWLRTDAIGQNSTFCYQVPTGGSSGYGLSRLHSADFFLLSDPPRFDPINDPVDPFWMSGCSNYHTFKSDAVDTDDAMVYGDLLAWPNPATNVLNIQLPEGTNEQTSIVIADITGKRVDVPISNIGDGRYSIETLNLPAGTYVAVLRTEQQSYRQLFVVK